MVQYILQHVDCAINMWHRCLRTEVMCARECDTMERKREMIENNKKPERMLRDRIPW